jgi:hypothetical protein
MTPPHSALAAVESSMTLMLRRICGESRWRATLDAVAVIVASSIMNNALPVAAPGLALATT